MASTKALNDFGSMDYPVGTQFSPVGEAFEVSMPKAFCAVFSVGGRGFRRADGVDEVLPCNSFPKSHHEVEQGSILVVMNGWRT